MMELDAAKAEGDLPGLAYLDTPRGVNAIVQRFTYGVQVKWLSHGSTYKQLHCVPFPPFPSLLPSSTSKHKLGMIQVSTLFVKPTWLK